MHFDDKQSSNRSKAIHMKSYCNLDLEGIIPNLFRARISLILKVHKDIKKRELQTNIFHDIDAKILRKSLANQLCMRCNHLIIVQQYIKRSILQKQMGYIPGKILVQH